MGPQTGTVLVVVAYYDARPADNLAALLKAMRNVPAGWPFATRVVVNRGENPRSPLPQGLPAGEVVFRENVGFNIGAWEHGWRAGPAYDAYLFVQDDCQLVRPDWVGAFARKAREDGVGLVGECLSVEWDAPWEELTRRTRGDRLPDHRIDGRPAERVPCYLDFLRRQGIDPGLRGDHLQSLVLFARREVLEAAKGFPVGRNYGEAIAAEIGITKKVQRLGLRACEVGPEPFYYIQHPQWLYRRRQRARAAGARATGLSATSLAGRKRWYRPSS